MGRGVRDGDGGAGDPERVLLGVGLEGEGVGGVPGSQFGQVAADAGPLPELGIAGGSEFNIKTRHA